MLFYGFIVLLQKWYEQEEYVQWKNIDSKLIWWRLAFHCMASNNASQKKTKILLFLSKNAI